MDNQKNLPLLLTMGDPAGVGPEIAVKALCGKAPGADIVVVGDAAVMSEAAKVCGAAPRFNVVASTSLSHLTIERSRNTGIERSRNAESPVINVIDMRLPGAPRFPRGVSDASCGRAAYSYIVRAIELCMAGQASGVVTGPISKESLKLAGICYPGHTEIFADRTGTADYSMVFLLDGVAVAHVTTHVSLRKAIEMITGERVLRQIRLLRRSLSGLGISEPKMAVSGLNPHAGENGLFGDEEIREIIPAIKRAKEEGIEVAGPLPPDTVFNRAFKGEFNGVVSMLHDHGFVALKSRDFEHGVNITVGLPIIRTSVGHGTAFDIAWKGQASCESLLSAIKAAESMSKSFCL
ncbi:MAG: 4-hydroxythreonine-4-phosphate dehydrogenase PdxA [Chitinispirillales bacterium]|jgi:4-hydroxythreonine-4-phosphate dehydrogenase|nr:4-hydroxythreonine-4-phosphate dehydrogenase PdxA [Chitinispirillales bacterium]